MTDFIFAIILLTADVLCKFLAIKYLVPGETVTLIPGILGLRYITNTGAAFSIFSGKTLFLVAVTSAALLFIGYMLFVRKHWQGLEKLSFLLIFAGGAGNLIDRVFRGYVVDYFEFLFMDFAIFNLADVYVCVGVAIYLIALVSEEFLKKDKNIGKDRA